MNRLTAAVVPLIACALLAPSVASARWTHPIPIESGPSSPYAAPAVAVAGRGDAAVAWETVRGGRLSPAREKSCGLAEPRPASCSPTVTIKVAVWTANREKVIRTLWRQRVNPTMRIAVATTSGEVTVAWAVEDPGDVSESLHVAYGPLKGRWQPSRVLAHFSEQWFTGGSFTAYPQLAVAPNGTVVASWSACRSVTACPRPAGGVELAWRVPGRGFSAPQLVREAPEGARPVYDVIGNAYLYSPCSGRILLASAGSRRFTRTVTLARGPVSGLTVGTSGAGEGLVTWAAAACSTDRAVGDLPGPVLASALKGGVFSASQVLTPPGALAYDARSAAAPGGGIASWRTTGSDGVAVLTVRAVGTPGQFAPVPAGSEPVDSTGGGDILFTPAHIWPSETVAPLVLPRRGARAETAPATSGVLTAAPFARLAAVAWYSAGLKLAVWRSELLP